MMRVATGLGPTKVTVDEVIAHGAQSASGPRELQQVEEGAGFGRESDDRVEE